MKKRGRKPGQKKQKVKLDSPNSPDLFIKITRKKGEYYYREIPIMTNGVQTGTLYTDFDQKNY